MLLKQMVCEIDIAGGKIRLTENEGRAMTISSFAKLILGSVCIGAALAACGTEPRPENEALAKIRAEMAAGTDEAASVSAPAIPIEELSGDALRTAIGAFPSNGVNETLIAYAKKFLTENTLHETRLFSNALRAGKDVEQNINAANALAFAAYEQKPEAWSAIRVGRGHLLGRGLPTDYERALEIFSADDLKSNSAAQYFRAEALKKLGRSDEAKAAYTISAQMGNRGAQRALDKMK